MFSLTFPEHSFSKSHCIWGDSVCVCRNVLCTTPTFSQLHIIYTVKNHSPSARGLDLRQANSHTNSKLGSLIKSTSCSSHWVMTVQKPHVCKQVNLIQVRALSRRKRLRRLNAKAHSYLKCRSRVFGLTSQLI